MGVSNGDEVGKITIFNEYLAIGSMTVAVRTTTATVDRAVYRTDHQASVMLFITTGSTHDLSAITVVPTAPPLFGSGRW